MIRCLFLELPAGSVKAFLFLRPCAVIFRNGQQFLLAYRKMAHDVVGPQLTPFRIPFGQLLV
ncbi:MAG TPA: hypothetical protein PKE00_12955, partial [Planctomycetota bacterium]|nr:hypothetical protein [Planctomycetota bacterium]